ncbi:uncharacterized protein EMH_0018460 [Eimeria mitis]|uniref:Uncharacterized protein n=1 Tax=Eimeria mitis TaxID=44415 RepID=U6KGN7_9EIME|nr:uncharacterized protein EMH_0018460 [Eimeria mitis]CDJ35936.1 hypothetical protein EMH_0018460 [Eimeria mitis]
MMFCTAIPFLGALLAGARDGAALALPQDTDDLNRNEVPAEGGHAIPLHYEEASRIRRGLHRHPWELIFPGRSTIMILALLVVAFLMARCFQQLKAADAANTTPRNLAVGGEPSESSDDECKVSTQLKTGVSDSAPSGGRALFEWQFKQRMTARVAGTANCGL